MMDQNQYDAEDFAADGTFRAWALGTDATAKTWWDNWLAAHADKRPLAEEARQLVLLLQFRPAGPSLEEMEEVRNRIGAILDQEAAILGTEAAPGIPEVGSRKAEGGRVRRIGHLWYRLAAVAASVLVVCLLYIFWQYADRVRETTGYATTKRITLPDGSSVLLNAHSRIIYSREWAKGKDREVWVEGEAFFEVTRQPSGNQPTFTVHTKGIDILVLGTSFNVYDRREEVKVVLESGKIMARGIGKARAAGNLILRPGQMVRLDSGSMGVKDTDIRDYISWKDQRLNFTNRSLEEVAQVLEDNYGYTVIWKKEELKQMDFTGSCPTTDIQVLLSAIQAVYGAQVDTKKQLIVFE